jgi:hypothetical protein
MIHLKKSIITFATGALILLNSCSKDEQVVSPTIDNEALTTVQLQLTNVADADDKPIAQWEQLLDNNGNPEPVDISQANLTLKAKATYSAKLVLLDKTQNPVFVVSDEIQERANYHLFFYQPLPTNKPLVIPHNASDPNDVYPGPIPTPVPDRDPLTLTVTLTDHDTNPQQYPVGLESTFTTGAASTGWLRVVLRHQPNSKNGTYAPGSTDLDVGFVVTIQ